VLETLVAYRLIDPGSDWRLHRQWFDISAMADLLEDDFAPAQKTRPEEWQPNLSFIPHLLQLSPSTMRPCRPISTWSSLKIPRGTG